MKTPRLKDYLREQRGTAPEMERIIYNWRYAVNNRDASVFRRQKLNYDTRQCLWPYQSEDGRKWTAPAGQEPFPWKGASDARVRLTELYIRQDVAICMVALRRQRTIVSGTELGDSAYANRLTNLLRWMKFTQMAELFDEYELLANTLFERGGAVMKTYWCREQQQGYDTLDLATLAKFADQASIAGDAIQLTDEDQKIIDAPALVMDPSQEAAAAEALAVLYPDVQTRRLRQVVKDLREQGTATFPRPYVVTDRPQLRALIPNEEIFISPEATLSNLKKADHYERELLNETELVGRTFSHGWDEKWINQVLRTQRGRMSVEYAGGRMRTLGMGVQMTMPTTERLFEVIHGYEYRHNQDGVPGIYYTCFSPGLPDSWAYSDLLNYDHGENPFTFVSTEKKGRLLDDARGYGEIANTWQQQIKVEWDSRIDRSAIATLPPSYYPPGEPPSDWGPGVQIPTDRPQQYGFMEAPRYDIGSKEVQEAVREFADEFFGRPPRDGESPIYADALRQHLVNNFLAGTVRVDTQVLQLLQQFMPDSFYYRIVGDAKGKPIHATREEIQGKVDVAVSFDIGDLDPERKAAKIELMQKAIEMDTTGRIDRDEALTVLFELIDPSMGERLLRAPQDAAQSEIDDEDTAFAKISAGLQVDIRPGQAYQLRLQRLQNILQTNPLAQVRFAKDPQFKDAIERRMQQLTFQLQQQQNAITGRFLGTQTQEAEQMAGAIGK